MSARLKEQDPLIKLIRGFILDNHDGLLSLTVDEAFSLAETLVAEHVEAKLPGSDSAGAQTRLERYAPHVHRMFVPLDLRRALSEYNERQKILRRKFVPPTHKEIRHILNIATVHAAAPKLRLITLDADDTIYEDGGTLRGESGREIVEIILRLIVAGVNVALVTAAGYPGKPERYEERLKGLLEFFDMALLMGADALFLERFFVMGGECNYLHKVVVDRSGKCRIAVVPGSVWKDGRGVRWSQEDITELLDKAEECLVATSEELGLDIRIIRKDRAIGMIRAQKHRYPYEVLEEVALSVQHALKDLKVPHCAFNGGNDVWVDVGNKALGIRALQTLLKVPAAATIHVGDRFTRTGNDTRAREVSNGLWVCNPGETVFVLRLLLRDLHKMRYRRAAGAPPPPAVPLFGPPEEPVRPSTPLKKPVAQAPSESGAALKLPPTAMEMGSYGMKLETDRPAAEAELDRLLRTVDAESETGGTGSPKEALASVPLARVDSTLSEGEEVDQKKLLEAFYTMADNDE